MEERDVEGVEMVERVSSEGSSVEWRREGRESSEGGSVDMGRECLGEVE